MVQAETQAERAFDQVVEWLDHFESLEDPRQAGKVWYPLDEVLLLCLVAVLAEVKALSPTRVDVLSLDDGIPADKWIEEVTGAEGGDIFVDCLGPGSMRSLKRGGSAVDIRAIAGESAPAIDIRPFLRCRVCRYRNANLHEASR